MSLTQTRVPDGFDFWGQNQVTIRDFTGDSSYPTGGYSLTGTNFGFGTKLLRGVVCIGGNAASVNYRVQYDNVNKKLLVLSTPPSVYTYSQADIKGSVTTDVGIASGTLQTNGALLSSLAAANNTTAFTIATQPDIPRNVGIAFKNTNAGASTGNAVDVVIVGTFRGAAQTETISFSALELTSTAQNEVATKYGVKPFDMITSITPSAAQPANWQHAAGIGSKLGLPVTPSNNAETDIIRLTKNAAVLTITGTYSTNQTVNFGTLSDGDDISVEYNTGGQQPSGTNLSTITWRLLGICRG